MKKNDRVLIFEDPQTEEKREGFAHLIHFLHGDEESEYWEVVFDGEQQRFPRWIKTHGRATFEVAD